MKSYDRRGCCVLCGAIVAPLVAIGTGLVLYAVHLVPFAPWVPTAQKGVILSFAAWIFGLAVRPLSVRGRCVAGLGWQEYVTGPLSEAEENAWWARGKPQYSIFSKRYNIAFAGYAAEGLTGPVPGTERLPGG